MARLPEIDWFADEGFYESALVYGVDPTTAESVEAARSLLTSDLREQLRPHLTLCFLGRMRGAEFAEVWSALAREVWPDTLRVAIDGVGYFESNRGRVTNAHLRIEATPELMATHGRACAIGSRFAGFSPGPHVGAGYQPHISIVDQVELDQGARERLEAIAIPSRATLSRPTVVGKRVDPVQILSLSEVESGSGSSWGRE